MAGRRAEDLEGDYEAAGFGNRLGFGERPALVIVDFCRAYLEPGSPLYAGVEGEEAVNETLLKAARRAEIPIVFTRVEYQPGGIDGGYFFKKVKALECFVKGNPLADFPAGLTPRAGEIVVTKQYASAFFATSLASSLRALGVDCCIITGLSTSGCVRATALDALQSGFIPIVVADGCGDRDARVHDANLFDLAAKYADVVSHREVLGHLRTRAR